MYTHTPSHVSQSHLKARFDDGDWQHADSRDTAGSSPQQHGLQGMHRSVAEVVLLHTVVGAEVDSHTGDTPYKRLPHTHTDKELRQCGVMEDKHILNVQE